MNSKMLMFAAGALAMSGVLTACGSSPASTTTNAAVSSGTHATLTVWSYYSTPGELQFLKVAARLFNKHYPNVKVNYVEIPFNQLDSKVLAAATTHSGPDVVIDNPDVDFQELAHAGALGNMTPYWNSYRGASKFPSSVAWRYDGKVEVVQTYVNLLALWYNKTLLQKLGLKVPTSLATLEHDMSVAKAHGYTGMVMDADPGVDGAWQLYPWLAGRGVTFSNFNVKTATSVLTMLKSWKTKGWVLPNVVTNTSINTVPQFIAGKDLFMVNGNWNITDIEKEAKFKFGVTTIPAGPDGTHVLLGGEGEAIGGYAKNPQLAFEYLRYGWFSQEGGKQILSLMGSLPTRNDLSGYVKGSPYQTAFLTEVPKAGKWPSGVNESTEVTNIGNTYSAVMDGSQSPSAGAQTMKSELQ